jgi:DNA-binding NarL/FixJ family response regulator
MNNYTIVLADDHVLLREGVRNMIETVRGLKVVGEVGDGNALLRLLKTVTPEMVVLDISMPGLRGIEAAREIDTQYPKTAILILSMHKSQEFLSLALEAGADGYLLKEDTSEELLRAIEQIRNGHTYLSTKMAEQFPTDIISICRGRHRKKSHPDALTHRERQILKLISEGHTDKQISELLFISYRTVQRHRFNIREKLNIKHTADLVRYAMSHGYTQDAY